MISTYFSGIIHTFIDCLRFVETFCSIHVDLREVSFSGRKEVSESNESTVCPFILGLFIHHLKRRLLYLCHENSSNCASVTAVKMLLFITYNLRSFLRDFLGKYTVLGKE